KVEGSIVYGWLDFRRKRATNYLRMNPDHPLLNNILFWQTANAFARSILREKPKLRGRIFQDEQRLKLAFQEKIQNSELSTAWREIEDGYASLAKLPNKVLLFRNDPVMEGQLFSFATNLVRRAQGNQPFSEKSSEYKDLLKEWPIDLPLEKLFLKSGLQLIDSVLEKNSEDRVSLFGDNTVDELVDQAFANVRIQDPVVRGNLFEGGRTQITTSDDTLISLATRYLALKDKMMKQWNDSGASLINSGGKKLTEIRYQIDGESVPPNTNLRHRVSFGRASGFIGRDLRAVPFKSVINCKPNHRPNVYENCDLPPTWLTAYQGKNGQARMFQVDADVVGGNSGSPIVNTKGRVSGIVFATSVHAAGNLGLQYYAENSRGAGNTMSLILTNLKRIYGLGSVADEIVRSSREFHKF
ncbi:MAG: S46 family peptidase, partial [Bdellovibrionales bacterium]|nr:S46 family peptidase [Bdellovibrionales bacterium]